jgi:hypothetical protein
MSDMAFLPEPIFVDLTDAQHDYAPKYFSECSKCSELTDIHLDL